MKTWVAVAFDSHDLGQVKATTKELARKKAWQRWGLQVAYVEIVPKPAAPPRHIGGVMQFPR